MLEISQTFTAILGKTKPLLATGIAGYKRGCPDLAFIKNLGRASPQGSTLPLEAMIMAHSSGTSLLAEREKTNQSILITSL